MRKRLFGLLATTAIVFAACQGAATPSPTSGGTPAPATPVPTAQPVEEVELFNSEYPTVVEAGTDGGTLIIGDWQEATQFNPFYLGQVTEANVASAAWATLIVASHDYKWLPDLAAEIPTTENGGVVLGEGGDAMTITWKLRDGLKWSDGAPLTCDDFKYAWEWVLDPDNVGVITQGYEDITAFDCMSSTEMVQHWKTVYSSYLTVQVAPLPRHFLASIPVADQVAGAGFRPDEVINLPVSGAFKFESVTPGQDLRLARNDNYTSPRSGKPAHLDTLIFKWYTDADAMIAGYRGGEIDFATDLQDSDLVKVEDLGDQVSAIPALLYEFWRPNWSALEDFDAANNVGGCSRNAAVTDRGESCPVADPAVRQAVSTAIDKAAINERLLGNSVQLANTNILPGLWYFSDQPSATFDPEKSKATLEAAGWVDSDGDGVREKDGIRLKIELCTTTRQVRIDTLTLGAAWLKDVGIEAIVNAVSRRISSPTTTSPPGRPRASLRTATSISRSMRSRRRSTRTAASRRITARSSTRTAATMRRSRTPISTRPSKGSGTTSTSRSSATAWRSSRRSTFGTSSRSRCTTARTSSSMRRTSGTSSRTRPRPARRGTRSTGTSRGNPDPC